MVATLKLSSPKPTASLPRFLRQRDLARSFFGSNVGTCDEAEIALFYDAASYYFHVVVYRDYRAVTWNGYSPRMNVCRL